MRIDVVSIFPEYLAPLELSLIGKARQDGLLDLKVHDLRDFTTDRHRTVDDTPYGGGAGMVMKPEPWAQALAAVAAERPRALRAGVGRKPVLIVPSPAGERFTQATGPGTRRRGPARFRLRPLRGHRRTRDGMGRRSTSPSVP